MSLRKSNKKVIKQEEIAEKCPYCKKSLTEKQIYSHSCEKKRRWMEKDMQVNKTALVIFQKFFEVNFRTKKKKTYEDFMNSQYFTAFVNFARHLTVIDLTDKEKYIEYIIRSSIPLEKWALVKTYEDFMVGRLKKESLNDAFVRSLKIIQNWCEENNKKLDNFYNDIEIEEFISYIRSGKISPWILFLNNGENILQRMNEKEIDRISYLLDESMWTRKLELNKKRIQELNEMLEEVK